MKKLFVVLIVLFINSIHSISSQEEVHRKEIKKRLPSDIDRIEIYDLEDTTTDWYKNRIKIYDWDDTVIGWYNSRIKIFYYANLLPTDITLSASTIDENSSIGTEIGTLSSIGQDTEDTYILSSGDGDTNNGSFIIIGDKLLSGEAFDFGVKPSHTVRVQTDDGKGGVFSKSFTISVIDVNEDIDGDGIMDAADTCSDTPTGETVNSIGCSENQWSINDELLDKSLKLYPNPVNNVLTIASKNVAVSKVEIYSIFGKKIKDIHLNFKTIRTDNLSKGLYLIKIYSEKGMVMKKVYKRQ